MEANHEPKGLLCNLDFIIAGIALAVLVLVTFVGVFARYFAGMPFAWEEEFQLACFVWITFLGVGAAFRSGSHVAIELLVERMPERIARCLDADLFLLSVLRRADHSVYGDDGTYDKHSRNPIRSNLHCRPHRVSSDDV